MKEKSIYVTQSSMPSFDEYVEMIRPMWETHKITNMGAYHNKLERELKEYLHIPNISLMVNGHIALEMAIQVMNFPKGSEIITTPFTFVSTTHAIIRNGLVPIFCDIKLDDYTLDENKIEDLITDKTVAILPVHVYGNICNYKQIDNIAKKYNLKVIYDSAHAFGETINNIPVETLGDMSILSFHATKVFNTIEGGAVCFAKEDIYDKLYNLKNFGIRSEDNVVSVGANGKMNEFSAAMGICNLKNIEVEIKKREERTIYYDNILSSRNDIKLRKRDKEIKYNFGYYPIMFDTNEKRDSAYKRLKGNNIYARKYFYPITADLDCFKGIYMDVKLNKARFVSDRILTLPLYSDLMEKDIERICKILNS